MKKYLLILFGAAALIIAGLPQSAFSLNYGFEKYYDGITYDYGNPADIGLLSTGTYLGTVYDENDDKNILMEFLEALGWTNPIISYYGKDESGELFIPESQSDGKGGLVSGTWQTYPDDIPIPVNRDVVEFLIVKGGTSFSVHQYDPFASRGLWDVGYLAEAGRSGSPASLSHLTAYNGQTNPVPEPASILLIGTGLLGLVGYQRKKWFAQKG